MLEPIYDGNGNLATEAIRESIPAYLDDMKHRARAAESGAEVIAVLAEMTEQFGGMVDDMLNEINKLQDENAQLLRDTGGAF